MLHLIILLLTFANVECIVGGGTQRIESSPWQVSINKQCGWFSCSFAGGGVIISNKWVLTAAHVIKDPQDNMPLIW